ncbi:MAG: hypothetical protein PF508_02680 [Spirochaeta sp.]|jgi:hypothetical protein|nr:hypothetical protein [Spirochaeta sp.]
MKAETVQRLQSEFDALSQTVPGEGIEFWFTRDLMEPLGYARWENFLTAIKRAIESCEITGYKVDDHFRGVTKMIEIGKGGQRPVEDFKLGQRSYKPEKLAPEEDTKKLERRVRVDENRLEKQSSKLPHKDME